MQPCPYPVEALLPHARPMILIDRVIGWSLEAIEVSLQVRVNMPFFEARKGVAAHIAIEWMAQACGAYVGIEALATGRQPQIGFLLGTRNFTSSVGWFSAGSDWIIRGDVRFRDAEAGSFDCAVRRGDETVASATLTLHQPSDLAAILASQGVQLKP